MQFAYTSLNQEFIVDLFCSVIKIHFAFPGFTFKCSKIGKWAILSFVELYWPAIAL